MLLGLARGTRLSIVGLAGVLGVTASAAGDGLSTPGSGEDVGFDATHESDDGPRGGPARRWYGHQTLAVDLIAFGAVTYGGVAQMRPRAVRRSRDLRPRRADRSRLA